MPRQGKHPKYRESMDSTRRNEEFRKILQEEQDKARENGRQVSLLKWPPRVTKAATAAKLARRFGQGL